MCARPSAGAPSQRATQAIEILMVVEGVAAGRVRGGLGAFLHAVGQGLEHGLQRLELRISEFDHPAVSRSNLPLLLLCIA